MSIGRLNLTGDSVVACHEAYMQLVGLSQSGDKSDKRCESGGYSIKARRVYCRNAFILKDSHISCAYPALVGRYCICVSWTGIE